MDEFLRQTTSSDALQCVDMHTTGEPVRILYRGFPDLPGVPLQQQRTLAKKKYDYIRKRLMHEPRGHKDMFGAIIVRNTELTASGEADIGVLFMHNEGYGTMCGHSTLALGRFLIDCWDEEIFPGRSKLPFDSEKNVTTLRLHVPAGVVTIEVPMVDEGTGTAPTKSVADKKIAFLSVPSFVTAVDLQIEIPSEQLQDPGSGASLSVDICYGGGFFVVIDPQQLGFEKGLKELDLAALDCATKALKDLISTNPRYRKYFRRPDQKEDSELVFSVIVVDQTLGTPEQGTEGTELGVCFFGNQQVDRSPTGSSVAARVALAYAKGERKLSQKWTYHSIVSMAHGQGAFISEPVVDVKVAGGEGWDGRGVVVRTEGQSFYTGAATFVVEEADTISKEGFVLDELSRSLT